MMLKMLTSNQLAICWWILLGGGLTLMLIDALVYADKPVGLLMFGGAVMMVFSILVYWAFNDKITERSGSQ